MKENFEGEDSISLVEKRKAAGMMPDEWYIEQSKKYQEKIGPFDYEAAANAFFGVTETAELQFKIDELTAKLSSYELANQAAQITNENLREELNKANEANEILLSQTPREPSNLRPIVKKMGNIAIN